MGQLLKTLLIKLLVLSLVFHWVGPVTSVYGVEQRDQKTSRTHPQTILLAQGGMSLDEDSWDNDPFFDSPPPMPKNASGVDKRKTQRSMSSFRPNPVKPVKKNEFTATVDSRGGQIGSLDAGILIEVPPGALSSRTHLSIKKLQKTSKFTYRQRAFKELVQVGGVELKPSGLHFGKPVQVTLQLDHPKLQTILSQNGYLEVGHYSDGHWLREDGFQFDGRKYITVEVTHFSNIVVVAAMTAVILGIGAYLLLQDGADILTKPWKYIVPDATFVKNYVGKGHIKLPKNIKSSGSTSLGLGRSFKPYSKTRVYYANGAQMLRKRSATCIEMGFFAATLLLADGNPRYQNFIGVQGNATDPKTNQRIGHLWLEIKIDGKLYVVDTANTRDISLMPKEEAYKKYNLEPSMEFTDKENSRKKYVGLEEVKTHKCNTLIRAGENEALHHVFQLGKRSGRVKIEYDTLDIEDQIIITYEGQSLLNSKCVGTNGTRTIIKSINGTSDTVQVRVIPQCRRKDNTRWNLKVYCPE